MAITYLSGERIQGLAPAPTSTHTQSSSNTLTGIDLNQPTGGGGWGIKITSSHTLVGKKMTSITFNMRIVNAQNYATQTITLKHFGSAPATIRATGSTMSTDDVATSSTDYTFTFANPVTIQADDFILMTVPDDIGTAGGWHATISDSGEESGSYVATWTENSSSFSIQTGQSRKMTYSAVYESGDGDVKPTNVPVGTRYEETNTRKIYRWGGAGDNLGSTLDATNNGATADSATAINGKASLTFDNSNDWINLGTGLNSSIDGNAFSISAWAYVSATNLTEATIIGKQVASYADPYHVFNFRANSGNWALTTNDGTDYQGDSTTAISHTGWTHIVATFDGTSSFKVYADNVEVCSYSNANTNWSNSYWSLGNGEGTTRWWNSEIQDVAIWSRVLTSGERVILLNGYLHGTATDEDNTGLVATDISTTGLLAYYTLNDTTTGVTNSAKGWVEKGTA
jgi:hypothetical protein